MSRAFALSVLVFALIGVTLLYGHTNGFNLTDSIAFRGFSALELVVQQAYPENFKLGFPDGAEAARASISSLAYLLPEFQSPEAALPVLYGMIALDIAFTFAGAVYLFYVLIQLSGTRFERAGFDLRLVLAAIVVGLLATASYSQSANLARFGVALFHGQFYGFADGARLFAIALVLQKRWALAAVAIGVAYLFHPLKAFWACIFLAPIALFSLREIFRPQPLLIGLAVAAVCAAWTVLGRPDAPGGAQIDAETFYLYTRAIQSHWYPFDLGVFDRHANAYFVPFLAAMLVAAVATAQLELPLKTTRALFYGMALLLVATAAGVVMSLYPLPPSLVLLQPIRASTLAISIALVVSCAGACLMLLRGRYLESVLIAGFFAGSFFYRQGFAEFMALFLGALFFLNRSRPGAGLTWTVGALLTINIGLVVWRLIEGSTVSDFIPLASLAPAALVVGLALASRFVRVRRYQLEVTALVALAVFSLYGALHWTSIARQLRPSKVVAAKNYYDVQSWARRSTEPDALFSVDPCIHHGWREFSLRSSIGTPAEWYMSGWLYGLQGDVFDRGQRITASIGYPIDRQLSPPGEPRKKRLRGICVDVRKIVYDPDSGALDRLSRDHDVDFFVAKANLAADLRDRYPIRFENAKFVVFEIEPASDASQ